MSSRRYLDAWTCRLVEVDEAALDAVQIFAEIVHVLPHSLHFAADALYISRDGVKSPQDLGQRLVDGLHLLEDERSLRRRNGGPGRRHRGSS
jgi:hypothetical protein